MDQLKTIKDQMISVVQGQMADIKSVDAKELGEAVDIIKDLAETMYYCSVTEAMEKSTDEEKRHYIEKYAPEMRYTDPKFYNDRYTYPRYYDDDIHHDPRKDEKYRDRMYYTRPKDMYYDTMTNGRSPMTRKMFMESKDVVDEPTKQKHLEKYIAELGDDITEMIEDLSPENKAMVKTRLVQLASHIV